MTDTDFGGDPEYRIRRRLKWFYIALDGSEKGPWSFRQMRRWHKLGWIKHDTPLRNDRESEFRSIEQRLATQDDEEVNENDCEDSFPLWAEDNPDSDDQDDLEFEDRWYYIDPQGIEQGPFTGQQMSIWFHMGNLPLNLRVRQVGEPPHRFYRLSKRKRPFMEAPSFSVPAPFMNPYIFMPQTTQLKLNAFGAPMPAPIPVSYEHSPAQTTTEIKR